ncbi:MAG: phosphoglycerate mutase [Microbacteriaceae bacterium]|nr:phosphoglycerate mutase [Burkholderiaceae bacterium]
MHLLIPFASSSSEYARRTLRDLKLPHLDQLLARLTPAHLDSGSEDTLSPPHERALARLLGLSGPDGLIPWAAHQARQTWPTVPGDPEPAWGWVTPCRWQVGRDHIRMDPPQALALQESDSRALLAAMQPYFEEDGISLHYDQPGRWLARSALFRDLATPSLDRVAGGDLDGWVPKSALAAPMRRRQNEMQMLLYTHPLNDARAERGLPPVNSFWLSGTGALGTSPVPSSGTELTVPRQLADAAQREDWVAWGQAWQQLDATECAALLAASEQPGPPERAMLTLCGGRGAQTFAAAPRSLWAKATSILGRQPLSNRLDKL